MLLKYDFGIIPNNLFVLLTVYQTDHFTLESLNILKILLKLFRMFNLSTLVYFLNCFKFSPIFLKIQYFIANKVTITAITRSIIWQTWLSSKSNINDSRCDFSLLISYKTLLYFHILKILKFRFNSCIGHISNLSYFLSEMPPR